ncbi:hypothetical protein [Burkholderia sp. PU8-34]
MKLDNPEAMRRMPDFTVRNPDQMEKFLVEVKYRAQWNRSLFEAIVEQVKIFGERVSASPVRSMRLHRDRIAA